jgi:ATP-dependent Clp protease ATP-binding subunit ClpC
MTSNIGSRELKEFGQGVGFSTAIKREQTISENIKGIIEKSLRRTFAPEFLNRIDDTIMFNPLTKEDIFRIIDIELKGLFNRIINLGYNIELTDEAKDFIAEQGYDGQFGARPLKRAIQKFLEDPLAEAIIREELKPGDTLQVEMNEEKSDVSIKIFKQASVSEENK